MHGWTLDLVTLQECCQDASSQVICDANPMCQQGHNPSNIILTVLWKSPFLQRTAVVLGEGRPFGQGRGQQDTG